MGRPLSTFPTLVEPLCGMSTRATIGGAFGLRVGLFHAELENLDGPWRGRRLAATHQGHAWTDADPEWDELVRQIDILANATRAAPHAPEEEALNRALTVLTYYQQADVSHRDLPILSLPIRLPVRAMLARVPADIAGELVALAALYRERFPQRLAGKPAILEPRCGVGNADLLAGGLLLEVKTTAKATVTPEYAYQLLGYILEAASERAITHCGWYFARQGLPWLFEVNDFLSLLAGSPVSMRDALSEYQAAVQEADRKLHQMRQLSFPSSTPVRQTVEWAPPFRPGVRGKKWHTRAADIPVHLWLDPDDPDERRRVHEAPACGSPVIIDTTAAPIYPIVGRSFRESDQVFCRKCLNYTDAFFRRSGSQHDAPE